MQDAAVLIDPTDGDAAARDVVASTVVLGRPLDQDALDELMEVVAPGSPGAR